MDSVALAFTGQAMKDGLEKAGQKLKTTFVLNALQAFKRCQKFAAKVLSALAVLSAQATTSST